MDTPTIPGAPAPVSSPAATPSTSTPSTSPAPATPATPAAAPAAPAATTPAAPDTRTTEQILVEKLTPAFSKDGTGGERAIKIEEISTGDAAPGEVAAAPAADATPAAEAAVAAPETAAAATSAEPADDYADFSLEDPTGYSPKTLADKLDADPSIKAALEANPELKGALFANARKAEKVAQFEAVVGTPEEAKVYVAGHQAFTGVSSKIAEVKDGDNTSYFAAVNEMLLHAAVRDEDGNPVKNADGTIRTDGSVGRLFKQNFRMSLDVMYNDAQKAGNDDLMAAIDILMESSGLRPSTAGNEEGMSEELKARAAEVKAGEERLATERSTQREADQLASDTRVDSTTDHTLDTAMQAILGKATALDAFTKTNVEREVRIGLRKAIANNLAYQSERRSIENRPLGPKREKALIELNQRTIREKLPSVARPILAAAGISLQNKTAERQTTQAARELAARSESRSSLSPAAPAAAAPASMEQVIADLRTKLGREPNTEQILEARMISKQGTGAAR